MKERKLNFSTIEKKWQKKWEQHKIFQVKESKGKEKHYVLEQFPYPSGSGLHMGHAFIYTIGDIYSRFKKMLGFNVLHPMGYDSLGLPAENAAIKNKTTPKQYTEKSISYFSKQLRCLGLGYDWSRSFNTHNPDYYKWDQWIFLKMFEKGLAYKKKSPVNWCPKCETVLANEQVHNGKCEYHGDTDVQIKHLEQWFLAITKYAEELANFDSIGGWPELIKKLQKNWIGKSYGTEINFEINGKNWPIFTTRPDTIYGVTFMVVSAQHEKLMELVTDEQRPIVEAFLKKLKTVSEKALEEMEKEGVFTGSYAINPVNGEKVPVYAGNFVVADYGSGMVMAVPAHDQRDFEFAKKYGIDVKQVIKGEVTNTRAYTGEGELTDSGKFNGIDSKEAINRVSEYLEKQKLGKRVVNYKLRDWLISRQRYWGTPIPIIYCDKCGVVPVPEKDLPIKLPEKVKFGKGNPLETNKNWIRVKCPKCGALGRRETDTMDTFVNSSWYYLRYCDSKNSKKIFSPEKANYWTPIDIYIGGKEHACMHDIYFRFYHKFLRDLGLLKSNEPALRLFVQGIVHGEDGNKMSKSLGNVIDPLDTISEYGADSLRLFLVSNASPESNFNWSSKGVHGSYKFLEKVTNFKNFGKTNKFLESKLNKTVKLVTEDINNFRYNLAVIKLRDFFDSADSLSKKDFSVFLKLLSVFCPHICEELYSKLGNKGFISLAKWPKPGKIDEKLLQQEEQIEKTIGDIRNILSILEQKGEKNKTKVLLFTIPGETKLYEFKRKDIEKRIGLIVEVKDIKSAKATGKQVKAKPGKPGIFLE